MTHPIVAFAAEVLRFPLRPRQAEILDEIYTDRIRMAFLRLGRRSGKDRIAAIAAVWEATENASSHRAQVEPDEEIAIVVVATSQRQAGRTHKYIAGFLRRNPELARLVKGETVDEIRLTNGMAIQTVPGHAASARGMAIAVVILTEAAHFIGRDGSPLDVKEVWDALVPGTLDFPDAKVFVLSTPKWAVGWFPEQCAQAATGEVPGMRHWHASTAEMRAGGPDQAKVDAFLAGELARDPGSYAREYEALFDQGIAAVFDADTVKAAVRAGAEILSPVQGMPYAIAMDPAATGDTFAVAVGHLEVVGPSRVRVVIDQVRGWRGSKADPVRIDPTLDAIAELSRAYNGAPVVTDQWAAQAITQSLAGRGVTVVERAWSHQGKVDAVGAMRQALYAGALEIPAHQELVAELCSLEQRPTPGGRPKIAAPGGGRDDYATAVMALVAELVTRASPEPDEYFDVARYERLIAAGAGFATADRLAWVDEMPPMPSISPV